MKNRLLAMMLCLTALTLNAQVERTLKVVEPLHHVGSVGTAECPKDLKGNYCAKVIVELPLQNVQFKSDQIVGEPKAVTGGYELFVVAGSKKKKLQLSSAMYNKLEIPLLDSEGGKLVAQEAYSVAIQMPSDQNAGKAWLTFVATNKKDIIVIIDGKEYKTDAAGRVELNLPYGEYEYVARADRYFDTKGKVILTGKPVTEDIEMKSMKGSLNVDVEYGATVYIDGQRMPGVTNVVSVGDHDVTVEMFGMKKTKKVYVPSEGKSIDMHMAGTLKVTRPSNATVHITAIGNSGIDKGKNYTQNTGDKISGLLGNYNVWVSKPGFSSSHTKQVGISVNADEKTDFKLTRIVDPYAFINYWGTPNAPIGFMGGSVKHWGWYIGFKTSPGFWSVNMSENDDDSGLYKQYFENLRYPVMPGGDEVDFSNFEKETRYQADITAGVMARLFSFLYVFGGAGWGAGETLYRLNGDESVLYTDSKTNGNGPVGEAGLMIRIGWFNILGGYYTRYADKKFQSELLFGAGFSINLD